MKMKTSSHVVSSRVTTDTKKTDHIKDDKLTLCQENHTECKQVKTINVGKYWCCYIGE